MTAPAPAAGVRAQAGASALTNGRAAQRHGGSPQYGAARAGRDAALGVEVGDVRAGRVAGRLVEAARRPAPAGRPAASRTRTPPARRARAPRPRRGPSSRDASPARRAVRRDGELADVQDGLAGCGEARRRSRPRAVRTSGSSGRRQAGEDDAGHAAPPVTATNDSASAPSREAPEAGADGVVQQAGGGRPVGRRGGGGSGRPWARVYRGRAGRVAGVRPQPRRAAAARRRRPPASGRTAAVRRAGSGRCGRPSTSQRAVDEHEVDARAVGGAVPRVMGRGLRPALAEIGERVAQAAGDQARDGRVAGRRVEVADARATAATGRASRGAPRRCAAARRPRRRPSGRWRRRTGRPSRRSVNRQRVTMRVIGLPHDREPGLPGVSENQRTVHASSVSRDGAVHDRAALAAAVPVVAAGAGAGVAGQPARQPALLQRADLLEPDDVRLEAGDRRPRTRRPAAASCSGRRGPAGCGR